MSEVRGGRGPADILAADDAGIASAVERLRQGGVVALPTDTVYGIAVDLSTTGGIERLFEVKRRPPDKGIMLLLDVAAQAAAIGVMTSAAAALAEACDGAGTIEIGTTPVNRTIILDRIGDAGALGAGR